MAIQLKGCAINKDFCPNKSFRDKIIKLLVGKLFKNKIPELNSIYDAMTRDINKPHYILYPIYGDPLYPHINKGNLRYPQTGAKQFNVWAGHDLPVWIGDPDEADIKLMIVSQNPRRNAGEMQSCGLGQTDGISISTPFGLHSYEWRSNADKGLIHYVVCDLLSAHPDMSIYYTDIYKLCGVDDKKPKPDKNNIGIYQGIFIDEMNLFDPDIVLLMGKDAQNAFNTVFNGATTSGQVKTTSGKVINVVCVPHPSGVASGTWKKIVSCPITAKAKKDYIVTQVESAIKI